jgi:hypothetical protein
VCCGAVVYSAVGVPLTLPTHSAGSVAFKGLRSHTGPCVHSGSPTQRSNMQAMAGTKTAEPLKSTSCRSKNLMSFAAPPPHSAAVSGSASAPRPSLG